MFKFFKNNKKSEVFSPANGTLIPLSAINDNMFSKGLIGNGFAIEPVDPFVYAPVEGEIAMIFPTLHAIGIKTNSGLEYILHIGIDTVTLKGKGFKVLVEEHDKVKAGTKLMEVDYQLLKDAKLSCEVICVVTNASSFSLVKETGQLVRKETKVAISEK